MTDTGNTLRQALTHVGLPDELLTHTHINRRASGFMLNADLSSIPG